MTDDAGLGVAVNVGLPLPARRVRVPGANVLGLEALELLLRAELVGLWVEGDEVSIFGQELDGRGVGAEERTILSGQFARLSRREMLLEGVWDLCCGWKMLTPLRGGCPVKCIDFEPWPIKDARATRGASARCYCPSKHEKNEDHYLEFSDPLQK